MQLQLYMIHLLQLLVILTVSVFGTVCKRDFLIKHLLRICTWLKDHREL